ncbi:hypothetical protein [Shewanella algae]|uniref:hypothetical protein n=1 Tax=Shewanella algae TaxID=38313 RepID=UPI001AADE622|nr:hypothetical protein [Shewanella algae]MBO2583968.1 hypothetical protein [Shewanella algae]MBO2659865.1 hypothetical protein [Shewanella algae]
MAIAKTKNALKQRLERFFSSKEQFRIDANDFLYSLSSIADTYVFGGMVRDICLFGIKGFESDIDVICSLDKKTLINALQSKNINNISENKFGGFRVSQKKIDIDIWCINDTWAFTNELIRFDGLDSILSTTLMTWDSVLYDFKNKKIICNDNYFDDLLTGRLELVLERTPNEIGAIVRVLRTIYGKHAQILGPKAVYMLKKALVDYKPDELIRYERKSYSSKYLNTQRIISISDLLRNHEEKKEISITSFKQLPLILEQS